MLQIDNYLLLTYLFQLQHVLIKLIKDNHFSNRTQMPHDLTNAIFINRYAIFV